MRKFFISTLLFFLASCGGGGGGGGAGSPTSSSSNNSSSSPINFNSNVTDQNWIASSIESQIYRTSEYQTQWALDAIDASEAYAVLAKNDKAQAGQGVKIGILDSGIDIGHADFVGKIDDANSYNYIGSMPTSNADTYRASGFASTLSKDYSDSNDHGTYVSSIVAAAKNNYQIHGLAFNSELVIGRVTNGGDIDDARAGIYTMSQVDGLKVINGSFGFGSYSSYNGSYPGEFSYDTNFINTLGESLTINDVLYVASSGNDGDNDGNGQSAGQDSSYLTNPKPSKPALYANNSLLAGYVLAVGSVDSNNEISDFSNICGAAKNYCLVAHGELVIASRQNSSGDEQLVYATGTSFSAPFVTAAAAILRAAWPSLTAPQTAQILLQTAVDLGEEGVDEIYGHGLLNIYAAVQSYGASQVPSGASIESFGFDVRDSEINSDPIFGDAFAIKVAPFISQAIYLDDFGRDYKANLQNKIAQKPQMRTAQSLNQILLPQTKTEIAPISFISKSGNFKNTITLKSQKQDEFFAKYAIQDEASRQKIQEQNRGFAFQSETKSGFSYAISQNLNVKNQENLGFLSFNSINQNPFQSFLQNSSSLRDQNADRAQKFNQFSIAKKFADNFKLTLSHQESFISNQNFDFSSSQKQNELSDFGFDYATKSQKFFVNFGQMKEFDENFLNSKMSGVFSLQNETPTNHIKFGYQGNFNEDLSFFSQFSYAKTKPKAQENGTFRGIFRDFSDVISRSMALGFFKDKVLGGKIGLAYHEPMRVISSSVLVDIPYARTIDGQVLRESQRISLKPNGKERNYEISYQSGGLSLNFALIEDALNIKRDNFDQLYLLNYRKQF